MVWRTIANTLEDYGIQVSQTGQTASYNVSDKKWVMEYRNSQSQCGMMQENEVQNKQMEQAGSNTSTTWGLEGRTIRCTYTTREEKETASQCTSALFRTHVSHLFVLDPSCLPCPGLQWPLLFIMTLHFHVYTTSLLSPFLPWRWRKCNPLQRVPTSRRRHITSPKTLNLHAVKNFTASLTSPFLVTSPHFLYLLSTLSQIMSSACLSNIPLNSIISFTHYLPTAG